MFNFEAAKRAREHAAQKGEATGEEIYQMALDRMGNKGWDYEAARQAREREAEKKSQNRKETIEELNQRAADLIAGNGNESYRKLSIALFKGLPSIKGFIDSQYQQALQKILERE